MLGAEQDFPRAASLVEAELSAPESWGRHSRQALPVAATKEPYSFQVLKLLSHIRASLFQNFIQNLTSKFNIPPQRFVMGDDAMEEMPSPLMETKERRTGRQFNTGQKPQFAFDDLNFEGFRFAERPEVSSQPQRPTARRPAFQSFQAPPSSPRRNQQVTR